MRFLLLSFVLLSITNLAIAGSNKCSQHDAMAAESEASGLKNWDSVYKSFKRYANCDDGAIAEGYSYSIAKLLAERWKSIGALNSLISKDKEFERFVVRHVDELMTYEQAQQMYSNVRSNCPSSVKKLCKMIENRLDATSTETEHEKR